MPSLACIGLGMLMFSVGALLIKTSRFTKVRQTNGTYILRDKKTGKEYLESKNGFIIKL